ncbi:MAG: DUF357 domain-containing protein [Candidatus Aenigmarchaeota archaeon]|nr:DUF357 domain-containing protein [Candidatus Aenigmarchaeota archaeon]
MDKTGETLKKETEKWLSKLEKERSCLKIISQDRKILGVLKNLDAYISDTRHFLEKGDFIRAFEAIIYAWGILETCEHLGIVERKK